MLFNKNAEEKFFCIFFISGVQITKVINFILTF